ncbi:MAG: type II/IV secretion system protein [Dethiobacter sp.]|nr:MAG: type II/IV secretion system protein [Dethiobacter sp.]
MRAVKKRLGDILIEIGAITEEQLKAALVEQKKSKKRLGRVLIEKNFLSEEKLLKGLEEQLKIPRVDLDKLTINTEAVYSIPYTMARRYNVLPVKREGKNLTVATADPLNVIAFDDIAVLTGCKVSAVIATDEEIRKAIPRYFGLAESAAAAGSVFTEDVREESAFPPEEFTEEAPVVQLVNSLLDKAIKEDASDIHLEPVEKGLRVRLRIDGVLRDYPSPSKEAMPLILSRLKIQAGMNIAEKRLPQDGNIQMEWHKKDINIRVSTLPTIYGEKLVLRLLHPDKVIMPIDVLGFNIKNRQRYLKFLDNAYGLILVTGPTGCGKTTTLYSTLHYINKPELNIITVEDPVEYRLDGINQVQVNNKINLTFANALRTMLRQDPNVIMVGEIRDVETAEIATRAALTGHLVFSTLHTNDAPRTVTRLLDMGVEPFLLTSSLLGVVAQRLVRLTCRSCKTEYVPAEEELALFREISGDKDLPVFFKGRGCQKCNFSGFKGRTAIHEVMPVDGKMRQLILKSRDTEEIRSHAVALGMQSLMEDGIQKVREGITTLSELMQAAYNVF